MPSRKHAARFCRCKTLHNYVSFSADDYKQENGMKYHTYPSLKSNEDRLALWDGLLRNDLQTMATDEYCTTFAFKIQGQRIDDVTGGHNGAETRVGITYNEGVVKRGMSLPRFVDVVSANAARLLGLYPRKGAIAPGSDADVVFIDPSIQKKLSMVTCTSAITAFGKDGTSAAGHRSPCCAARSWWKEASSWQ